MATEPKKVPKKCPKRAKMQKRPKCKNSKLTHAHPPSHPNTKNCTKNAKKNHSMQRKAGLSENQPKKDKNAIFAKPPHCPILKLWEVILLI